MRFNFIILLLTLTTVSISAQQLRMEDDFYQSGRLYSRGYFKRIDSVSETSFGLWTYWYENGQKMSEEIQSDTGRTKYLRCWTADGIQILKDGRGKMFKTWEFREYDITVFEIKDSVKNGEFLSYIPINGVYKKVSSGTYKYGLRQGTETIYYASGKTKLIQNFIDDKENGECTLYYENGQIKEKGFKTGYYNEGVWTYYDSDGTMIKKENYRDGRLSGEYLEYYPNGQVKVKGNYVVINTNIPNHTQKVTPPIKKKNRYATSAYGTVSSNINSVKDGIWLYYSDKGISKIKIDYSKGVVIRKTSNISINNKK
ncbi:MAG: hypothetical protein HYX40_03455 [Sphingobacteriales bacterium]|nr:hypothetical protein [Sphingobacteriales bacterium]